MAGRWALVAGLLCAVAAGGAEAAAAMHGARDAALDPALAAHDALEAWLLEGDAQFPFVHVRWADCRL